MRVTLSEWLGEVWLSRGVEPVFGKATGSETSLQNSQTNLYNTMSNNYKNAFGSNMGILSSVTRSLSPIIAAGPSQQGFSASENAALNSQAISSAAASYKQASQVANESLAARGGGNVSLPSGTSDQINAGIASSALQNLSNEQEGITEANYDTGRQNFFQAEGQLAAAPGQLENPLTSMGEGATSAGNSAFSEAQTIQQQNSAWEGELGGALGGIAGNVASGGMANLGKGKGFFG